LIKKISRRSILLRGLQLPVGCALVGSLAACGAGEGGSGSASARLCANPEMMSATELSTRHSLNYTDASPTPQKVCGGCSFFHAAEQGGCGNCDMLSGGLVNKGGHCDSWNPRVAG
jgi:High potential iron-sulfur protein